MWCQYYLSIGLQHHTHTSNSSKNLFPRDCDGKKYGLLKEVLYKVKGQSRLTLLFAGREDTGMDVPTHRNKYGALGCEENTGIKNVE